MKLAQLLMLATVLVGCQSPVILPATYIVFFRNGSASLTDDANASIARAAEVARSSRPSQIAIASGIAQGDNLRLAEPRFQAVQSALTARGVSAKSIVRSSLPDAALPTGAAADTRVEIILTR